MDYVLKLEGCTISLTNTWKRTSNCLMSHLYTSNTIIALAAYIGLAH